MLLTLLFSLLGGVATALTYLGCRCLSLWWLLPLWVGYAVALSLVFLLGVILMIRLFPLGDPSPRRRQFSHGVVDLILPWLLLILGMRVTATGTDTLPTIPFLLVGNHRSAFDPLCTITALPGRNMVFVAKPSVLNIPVIGQVLRRLSFLSIDRENARNAVTTIKQAAHLVADVGLSVGIYPEGTRSKTEEMLPFHAGSFKIAKLAECPVAVVSIRYEKSRILPWGKRVHIHVVEVLDADAVAQHSTGEMAEMAKEAIEKDLKK